MLKRFGYTHKAILAPHDKAGTEIESFNWLNVMLENLKTVLSATHHAFKFIMYAWLYLDEVKCRFNRPFDMAAILPRMAVTVIHTRPYPKLKILKTSDVRT